MQVPGQIGLFEFLEMNHKILPEDTINIDGVINTKTMCDFVVQSTYRDIFLIINMLDDYMQILKQAGRQRSGY